MPHAAARFRCRHSRRYYAILRDIMPPTLFSFHDADVFTPLFHARRARLITALLIIYLLYLFNIDAASHA